MWTGDLFERVFALRESVVAVDRFLSAAFQAAEPASASR
jgi:hypothetical protein